MTSVALQYLVTSACDGPFGSSLTSSHYSAEGTRVIRLGNIGEGAWREGDAAYIPDAYARTLTRHEARRGDIVVAGLGDGNHPLGRCVVVPDVGPAIVKADCFRLRLDSRTVDPRFFVYAMSAVGSREAQRRSHGSTRQRLPLGEMLKVEVPVPPLEEQRRIAEYLDTETARIDSLITKNSHAATLAEERVAAAVDDAIPQVRKVPLGYVADVTISNVDKHTVESDPAVRLCNYVDVYQRHRITGDMGFMNSTATRDQLRRFRLRPGDVVITKDSETADDIGIPALVACDEPDLVLGYHCGLLRPRAGLDGSYLHWVMRRRETAAYWEVRASGVTRVGLRRDDVRSLPVPMPDLADQRRIAATLWSQQDATDVLLARLEDQRGLLRERRQALITAVVTGELEV